MKTIGSLSVFLVLIAGALAATFGSTDDRAAAVPVVLISIDGLRPDNVLEADKYGSKIPNLRRLVAEGAHATGVSGVTPTVTYPAHATMVTGVSPAKHGIYNNGPFDPLGKNQGGWYWYAEDLKVPTLWDAAAKKGLVTSAVDWPTTVGANIPHNIAQLWRASTPDDRKLLRVVSTNGLLTECEAKCGPYTDGYDYTFAADRRRTPFNTYVIESRRPRFHLCYFSGLDTEEHRSGPFSAAALAGLELIDDCVGQVRAAAEKIGGGKAVICVVSDHGFARTDKEVHVNAALADAGLVTVDNQIPPHATAFRAMAWYGGGSAGIMLKDPSDEKTRAEVRAVLTKLAADPENGLDRVIEPPESDKFSGFPGAAFLVSVRPPLRFGSNLRGPAVAPGRAGGSHGYLPDLADMDASFFIAGPGVPAGQSLGRIDMRDIAATLAPLIGVELPTADGRNRLSTK